MLGVLRLIALPTAAVAATGPGSSSGVSVLTGETNPGPERLTYTATGSPTSAIGAISYSGSGGQVNIQATPVCIGVEVNRATIVGLITASNVPPPDSASVGNYIVIWVEDNGIPGPGNDRAEVGFTPGPGPTGICDAVGFVLGPPILLSDIVVTPAQVPTPTTVTLSPLADLNPVGSQHTVTATATATSGPVEGVTIRFRVIGASDAQGTCTTNSLGSARSPTRARSCRAPT